MERCTDRLLARADADGLTSAEQEEARHYVEVTYCAPFAERGWVYDDGTLSIAAHTWLEEGGDEECGLATKTGEETVPCETTTEDPLIDCALLHHVRRSEVRDYIEQLRRQRGQVECDDGTPLSELGAP